MAPVGLEVRATAAAVRRADGAVRFARSGVADEALDAHGAAVAAMAAIGLQIDAAISADGESRHQALDERVEPRGSIGCRAVAAIAVSNGAAGARADERDGERHDKHADK
jgi:hypothetical protein